MLCMWRRTFKSNIEIRFVPLVDKYLIEKDEALKVKSFPLSLCQCKSCRTYQINNIVDPKILYDDYIYTSSSSPDLEKHFSEYSQSIAKIETLNYNSSILEIGGNDGLLLNKLFKKGFHNLTVIDPAPQVNACEEFALVHQNYFGSESCEKFLDHKAILCDLIIANNCMAHIPNLAKIFKLIFKRLSSNGIFIFEVNSLYHMIVNDVFDYIYHEHIFYHSITSLSNLLGLAKLFINEVKFVDTKGGSFRIICSKAIFKMNLLLIGK